MTKRLSLTLSLILCLGFGNIVNAHITGNYSCKSTSGAYTTNSANYQTYIWEPEPFGVSIYKNGSMQMSGNKIPDSAGFSFVKGNAFGSGYYGRSWYSSFLLEPNGRFLFVQAMPGEAYMMTGICK